MTKYLQEIFERYPTLPATLLLCLGIVSANVYKTTSHEFCLAGLIAALIIPLAILSRKVKSLLWIVLGLLFFALGLYFSTKELAAAKNFQPPKTETTVHATIAMTISTGPGIRQLLLESGIVATTDQRLPGSGRLTLRDNPISLCAGDRVAFRSKIRKPVNRGNPGEFDWELECTSNGIYWLASIKGKDSILVLRRGSPFCPGAILFKSREAMTRFLDTRSGLFFDHDTRVNVRAILKGIVLGDLGEISPSLNRSFMDSGLVHALSASGIHVAIVALLALAMVKAVGYAAPQIYLWLPFRKLGAFASIPAMVAYCFLVGARVPAIRSTIMGVVVAVAILMDKRWNSLNSLASAALIILLIYPLSLFTPSFQLSFVAVAGILMIVGRLEQRIFGHGRHISENGNTNRAINSTPGLSGTFMYILRASSLVIFTSLAATLAIAPLILQTFHSFPLYTLPANLVTDFAMTIALSLGLVASAIGAVFPNPAAILLAPADVLVRLIISTSDFFSGLPHSTIRYAHMGILEFICMASLVWSLLWYIRRPSRTAISFMAASFLGLALLLVITQWTKSVSEDLKVVFLNVGKGDSAFVQAPRSNGLLIDGGLANEYFDTGRSIVLPFLDWNGTVILDGIIMTHPDMDHMGGLISVIKRVPPLRFWWNPIAISSDHLERTLDAARAAGASIEPATRACDPIELGPARMSFLNKPAPFKEGDDSHRNVNNSSVVCRLDYGQISFLFTGDLQLEGEEELMSAGVPLRATVLKVAHHGGKTGTTRRFLEAVKPEFAVISAEYPRQGGLPNMDVLNRIESAGTKILWTGRDGAITMKTDGKALKDISLGRADKATVSPFP